ncbi:MAG: hypothetical protein ACK4FF_12750 [Limnobacter sp.]|uniref:hypothetical protein n=1 Tax=Limnobacter sp. TaxID=2003368 RepID=UPI00391D7CCA
MAQQRTGEKHPLLAEQERLHKPLGLKRRLSWLLFAPILLGFLVLPVLAILYGPEVLHSGAQAQQYRTASATGPMNGHPSVVADQTALRKSTLLSLDSAWNPGPLASAHSALESDCQACHQGGFTRVADTSCTACHSNMGLHVTEQTQKDSSFTEGRCASCHHDHKGRESLAEQNRHFAGQACSDCHSQIKDIAPKSLTLPVSDFSDDKHPSFRLTVAKGPHGTDQAPQLTRIRMAKNTVIQEANTLKFPHDVHLDRRGIEGPTKKVVMACGDCHQPADTPSGFKPITMEQQCQSCHKLNFEPALPDRQAPHGPVDAVLSTIDEFYSYLALNPQERQRVNAQRAVLRNRPGEKTPNRSTLQAIGNSPSAMAALATTELFENTGCAVCHTVKRQTAPSTLKTSGRNLPQYSIAPVTNTHAWMPMATFNHKAHEFERCDSCHKAQHSKESSDVLMPDLASCQTCHSGRQAEFSKVQSDCGLCHNYHLHPKGPVGGTKISTTQ